MQELVAFILEAAKTIKSYLPDRIDLYEKMLDNGEPDDELTRSLRNDDVDTAFFTTDDSKENILSLIRKKLNDFLYYHEIQKISRHFLYLLIFMMISCRLIQSLLVIILKSSI